MKQKPAVWNLNVKTVTIQLSDDDWKKAEKLNFEGIWSFRFKPYKYEWCECGDELQTEDEKISGVCSLCESLGRKRGVSDV